jgi:hypothetical protein
VAGATRAPRPAGETFDIRRLLELTVFPEDVQEAIGDFDEMWMQRGS